MNTNEIEDTEAPPALSQSENDARESEFDRLTRETPQPIY